MATTVDFVHAYTAVNNSGLGVFLAVLLDEGVRALINFWKYLRIVKKWRE